MNNGSRVTQKDVYEAVKELRIEIIQEIRDIKNDVEELKDFRSRAYGIFMVVSLFFSGLFAWVWTRITGN